MGWRITLAGTARNGHVSRKCAGWHCEEVNCFTFRVLQILSGHYLRTEKLLRFYPTPRSHGDGRSWALVTTQPQGDAMRPLSWLTPVSASPAPHSARAQGHRNSPGVMCPFSDSLNHPAPLFTLPLLLTSSWSYLNAQNNTSLRNYTFNENQK